MILFLVVLLLLRKRICLFSSFSGDYCRRRGRQRSVGCMRFVSRLLARSRECVCLCTVWCGMPSIISRKSDCFFHCAIRYCALLINRRTIFFSRIFDIMNECIPYGFDLKLTPERKITTILSMPSQVTEMDLCARNAIETMQWICRRTQNMNNSQELEV